MITPELVAEERKNEIISGISTTIIIVVLLLLTLLWTAYRNRVPPPGEKEYEVLGAIDFGDYKNGSKRVNNFQPSVPDPAPAPPQTAKPVQQPVVAEPAPTPKPPVVTKAPSPVTQPEPPKVKQPDPKPTPPKTATPTTEPPKPETKPSPTPTNTNSQEKPELTFNNNTGQTGSNHGTSESGTGNAGTPNVKVLDPNGLYSFGTGSGGGLEGRAPLSLKEPQYSVQEEGELQFEFIIEPNGSVSYVKLVGVTNKPGLRDAGINAIKQWRFSALQPGQSQQRQTVRVTIKFRLKG
ncbi:MAG: TonB family protein [Bacteroidia bacterium]